MSDPYNLKLNPHERTVEVRPIGIKYVCPHCHVGSMVASDSDPFVFKDGKPISRVHYCDNCGARMDLPKTYPYIEWVPATGKVDISYDGKEGSTINETT